VATISKNKKIKIEIAREPARDGGANMDRFVTNDKRKKHMLICPSIFFCLNTHWCPK
jgi:hypothetical protein